MIKAPNVHSGTLKLWIKHSEFGDHDIIGWCIISHYCTKLKMVSSMSIQWYFWRTCPPCHQSPISWGNYWVPLPDSLWSAYQTDWWRLHSTIINRDANKKGDVTGYSQEQSSLEDPSYPLASYQWQSSNQSQTCQTIHQSHSVCQL